MSMHTTFASASQATETDVAMPEIGGTHSLAGFAARVFSFPVMCVSLVTVLIFRFSVRKFAEPDIWWHLRNAQYLFDHHSIPRVDLYSFGAAGSDWMNHQWLSEIPYYLAFQTLGLQGILAVHLSALVLIYAAVYYLACRSGTDYKAATALTALAVFFGTVSIGPRTLLFGWLCMVGLFVVLDHFRRSGKGLWLLPPLFALWINFHGSWVFGIAVLVFNIVSGLVEGEWGLVTAHRWSRTQLIKLLMAFVASVAALFANPYGYRLVIYPFNLTSNQPSLTKHLTEWQSVNISELMGKVAVVVLFVLLGAACFSRRRWRLDEVLLLSFALWFGLSHLRFLFFLGLIVPSILGPRLRLFPSYNPERDKAWLNAGILAIAVASVLYFFPSNIKLQSQVNDESPAAAITFMQQNHISGNVFNSYEWGGYMIWAAPEIRPFIDGRADIFGMNGTFDEYHDATILKGSFETLDKYKVDYVLFNPGTPLAYLLDHSPAWRKIYFDNLAVLYQRVPGTSSTVELPTSSN